MKPQLQKTAACWIRAKRNRITKENYIGNGHIRGYPGLKHTAFQIMEHVPSCNIYMEPFAGLGRTAKYAKANHIILNDMSDHAVNTLRKRFPNAIVTQHDWMLPLMIHDGPGVVELIDPPWRTEEYKNGCHGLAYCDRTAATYYKQLFAILPYLEGHWFVCGDKDNKALKDPRYHHKLFVSKHKIMGGNIATLVMSNKPFVRYHQKTLHEAA